MKVMLGRLAVLGSAFAAMALGTTAPAASAAECTKIWGAGSSLQKIAQELVWGPNWEKLAECASRPAIGYHSTSSGKGKELWGYKTGVIRLEAGTETLFPAFIGTDLAPNAEQIEKMGSAGSQPVHREGVMAVPVAQSAIAVMITLPKECTATSGTTANVNATELRKELEEGLLEYNRILASSIRGTSCARSPRVEVRSSNSGTTAGFKHYEYELSGKVEPWKAIAENALPSEEPKWPERLERDEIEWEKETGRLERTKALDKCCERGSELASTVAEHPAEIGYADLADANTGGFTSTWKKVKNSRREEYFAAIARVEVAAGTFENPEESGGASKCGATHYAPAPERVAPGEDWSAVKQSNVFVSGAYPICTLTFDLTWNSYRPVFELVGERREFLYKESECHTVIDYIEWIVKNLREALERGGQLIRLLTEKHYGPLPTGRGSIQEEAELGVNNTNIKCT